MTRPAPSLALNEAVSAGSSCNEPFPDLWAACPDQEIAEVSRVFYAHKCTTKASVPRCGELEAYRHAPETPRFSALPLSTVQTPCHVSSGGVGMLGQLMSQTGRSYRKFCVPRADRHWSIYYDGKKGGHQVSCFVAQSFTASRDCSCVLRAVARFVDALRFWKAEWTFQSTKGLSFFFFFLNRTTSRF